MLPLYVSRSPITDAEFSVSVQNANKMASTYYRCALFFIEITVIIGQRIYFNATEVTVHEGGKPVQICATLEGSITSNEIVIINHFTPSGQNAFIEKNNYE